MNLWNKAHNFSKYISKFFVVFLGFAQVKDNGTLPGKKKVIVLNEDHVNYNSIKLEALFWKPIRLGSILV